jgi:hypothetical protein
MTIRATITLSDKSQIVRLFSSFSDLDAWCERHRAHVTQIEARTIIPGEMRQVDGGIG